MKERLKNMRKNTLINLINNNPEASQEAKNFAIQMIRLKSLITEGEFDNQLQKTIIQVLENSNTPLRVKEIQAQIHPKVSIQKITGALTLMRRWSLRNRIKRTTKEEDVLILCSTNNVPNRIFSIAQPNSNLKPITRTIAFYSLESYE